MAAITSGFDQSGLRQRGIDWLPALLAIAVVLAPVYAVHDARWVEKTFVMFPLAVLGLAIGAAACRTRAPGPVVLALGVLAGVAASFVVAAEVFPGPAELWPSFSQMSAGTWEWLQATVEGETPGPQPLLGAITTSIGFGSELWLRLLDWFEALVNLTPSADNEVFVFWMATSAWGMGYFAAWGILRRRSAALAALPAGITLAINTTYLGPVRMPFVVFVVALLLLMVLVNMRSLTRRWEARRTEYAPELQVNMAALSLVAIVLAVGISVVLPRATANPLATAFWNYLGEGWSDVEAATTRLFSGVSNPSSISAFSGQQSFSVGASLPFSRSALLIVRSTRPYYWRGSTYDRFLGDRWENTANKLTTLAPDERISEVVESAARVAVQANFEIYNSDSSILYIPGDAVSVNRPYLVQSPEHGELTEFSTIRATRRVGQRLAYSAESTISAATSDQLADSPSVYPGWIDRYLQIPDVSPRVRELANRFGASGQNNFDTAQGIEFFLRRYPFAIDLPPPSLGDDVVDLYLFEYRRGHAEYAATAMAILARLNGLPSRLATGYVTGLFDEEAAAWVAGPEEVHTWAEVFFPGYGWVPFEPSGYRAPVARLGTDVGAANPVIENPSEIDFSDLLDSLEFEDFEELAPEDEFLLQRLTTQLGAVLPVVIAVAASVAGFALVIPIGLWLRSRLQSSASRTASIYRSMLGLAGRGGYNFSAAKTPLESAIQVADLVESATLDGPWEDAPGLRPPEVIAQHYARSIYGPGGLNPADRHRVETAWTRLRPALYKLVLRRWIKRIGRGSPT